MDNSKPHICFLKGISDDKVAKIYKTDFFQSNWTIDTGGSCNVFFAFNSNEFKKSVQVLDSMLGSDIKIPRNIDLIFNQISEPDTYKISLKKVDKIVSELNLKVVNHPRSILLTTRDSIFLLLKNIPGITVPKTIFIQPKTPSDIKRAAKNANLPFPALLRESGVHGGEKMFLVEKEADLDTLYAAPLDGRSYYLIEFKNVKNKQNLYIKYRLVIIDSEVYVRHAIVSEHWKVHASQRQEKYYELEKELLARFEKEVKSKIKDIFLKIAHILQLDYFGIDCSIDEDCHITAFEINASMNILHRCHDYLESYVDKIQEGIYEMVRRRL